MATYSIESALNVDEGTDITYIFRTDGVPNYTTFYWTNEGTTSGSDFIDGRNTGTFYIYNNIIAPPLPGHAQISRTLRKDHVTEGTETFILAIRSGSISGPIVLTAPTVSVSDISKGPTSTAATLSALSLSVGVVGPTFDPYQLSYSASVLNSISAITVTPVTANLTDTITVNGILTTSGSPSAPINLTVGSNTISIVVTTLTSLQIIYTIYINRAASGGGGYGSGTSDATLSSLIMSAGALSPAYTPGNSVYSISVLNSVSSISFTPTATNGSAVIRVNGTVIGSGVQYGPVNLNLGKNIIRIIVTALDGLTSISYALTVTRLDAFSSDNRLWNLTISPGTFSHPYVLDPIPVATAPADLVGNPGGEFQELRNYLSTVTYVTSSISLTAYKNNEFAIITIDGQTVDSGVPHTVPVYVGTNYIPINVIAQNGNVKTYSATIVRQPPLLLNENATLSSISLSDGTLTPSFASTVTNYRAVVANAVTSIVITPTATATTTTTIKINGFSVVSGENSQSFNLISGLNIFSVVSRAESGKLINYTVNVIKASLGSNNTALSSLTISNGTLTQATTTTYSATLIDAVTTTVIPTVANPNSTVKVNDITVTSGQESLPILLNSGINIISVVVTAEDTATTNEYIITITKLISSVTLASDFSVVNEGQTVRYSVATSNVPSGSVLYWTNDGTTKATDFVDSANTGSVTITNNTGTITRTLLNDLKTEGRETVVINLRSSSITGNILASNTVIVNDSSNNTVYITVPWTPVFPTKSRFLGTLTQNVPVIITLTS
jgi:hypothetical protein